MDYSKEDFDLVIEAIWQEYKTNPIKISHPQSLLSAALPVASHNYPKEKEGTRINFDPTQIAALKAIPNQHIRSIIYSLGAQEKVLKNCSPGRTVTSERPMTLPVFIPDDPLRFSLIIYDSFEKWYAGYQQIKNTKFENIDPENLLYIYDLALLINQKIQLTAAPNIIFDLGYTPKLEELDDIKKHSDLEERRKEILEYLQHRKIIDYWLSEYQNYGGDMSAGNKVTVTVLTKNWVLFFREVKAAYERSAKQNNPVAPQSLEKPKEPENKILYNISFTKNNEIYINDFLLKKPHFGNENAKVFRYLIENPNRLIKKKELVAKIGSIGKDLRKIVENLGFSGNYYKIFFQISKNDSVKFRNPISVNDLHELKLSPLSLKIK